MTQNKFKLTLCDLIMQMQCIENDLRLIYAAIKPGDFAENFDEIDRANLGKILRELRTLDYADGKPDLSEADYAFLDEIRETRNYWCHQCFLDYIYISEETMRRRRFQQIADRLREDESRSWQLHERLENIRLYKLKEYGRL